MAQKANFLSLPVELREQIFHYLFRTDGGYVYDAELDKLKRADNRPIELSLLYTCRTIANEARHIPLSLNTIKFTTFYRREWSSLAGCFNVVSATYHHLESDLTLLLAKVMTPEIHAQLASKFPDFGPRLARAVEQYTNDIVNAVPNSDDDNPAEGMSQHRSHEADASGVVDDGSDDEHKSRSIDDMRTTMFRGTRNFLCENIDYANLESPEHYPGFSRELTYDVTWKCWSDRFWGLKGPWHMP
jgi:hypothetical protein